MVKIRGENPNLAREEYTQVKAAAVAGALSIDVDNTTGYAVNDYIVIGELGTETCELVKISAVTDSDTLGIGALSFAHSVDESIRRTSWNQIRFQYCSTETGVFSDIETKDVNWQDPNQLTVSDYPTGTTALWYRYNFFNVQTSTHGTSSAAKQIKTYYCSEKDVSDWLNLPIDGQSVELLPAQVFKIIRGVTEDIERIMDTSWRSNSIATPDYEYFDGKKQGENQSYFSKHSPIISVDLLETTQSGPETGPTDSTYTALTEDSDFVCDKPTGRIRIIKTGKQPATGINKGRTRYTWGRSSVPEDIRRLAVLMSILELANTTQGRQAIKQGRTEVDLAAIERLVSGIINKFKLSMRSV